MATKTKTKESDAAPQKYDNAVKLFYNDEKCRWQVGEMGAEIWLNPALQVTPLHNINTLSITVLNDAPGDPHDSFSMAFDSVGMGADGREVMYTKFADAYEQLEKNKVNLERFLKAHIDISVLRGMGPLVAEFEKRADGRSPGNKALQFD